jgi:hypothetical protein
MVCAKYFLIQVILSAVVKMVGLELSMIENNLKTYVKPLIVVIDSENVLYTIIMLSVFVFLVEWVLNVKCNLRLVHQLHVKTMVHVFHLINEPSHMHVSVLIIRETNQIFLSPIIFAQLYFNSTSVYGSYYFLTFSNSNRSHLTTKIQEIYRCPHANEHLNSLLVTEPWLKRIKFYPLYMKHLKCFYDETYIYFIDKNKFPDCLLYNHNIDNCSGGNTCINDGKCLQSKKLGRYEFVCICPQCTAGEFCQIQLKEFLITLDSVLAQIILIDV